LSHSRLLLVSPTLSSDDVTQQAQRTCIHRGKFLQSQNTGLIIHFSEFVRENMYILMRSNSLWRNQK